MRPTTAPNAVFLAVADPTRRAILDRLRAGPTRAGDLAQGFSQSRPAISKHVSVLKQADLITETRMGRERLYQLNAAPLMNLSGWLEGYRSFWQVGLDRPKRNLEDK